MPPARPADPDVALKAELDRLQAIVAASTDAEAKARLATQDAEAARLEAMSGLSAKEEERRFWKHYAAETEAGRRAAETALAEAQAAACTTPPAALDRLAHAVAAEASSIKLDKASIRVLIDEQLRLTGWTVDSATLRYAAGTRPQTGRAIAIAEWPTASGPVDYALFLDGRCIGAIEAKRAIRDVPGRLGQAERYARDIRLTSEQQPTSAPWRRGLESFAVPFVFITNGRPYVKQLATKSGIWFSDVRPGGGEPRALPEWFSPRNLAERLEQARSAEVGLSEQEFGGDGLRPYQRDAISRWKPRWLPVSRTSFSPWRPAPARRGLPLR